MARKLRGKPVWSWSIIIVLVSICTGVVMANRHPFQSERYEDLKIFTEVLSYVEANYVEEVEPERVIHGAIRGMLRSLDPHSSFMPPEMFGEMQVETEGRFGGLGIEITIRDDVLTVVAPIEETPAFRAGVMAGDQIVLVEGESTKDMTLIEAVKRLRGPEGSEVTIGIMRPGFTEPRDFTIVRAIIKIKSVRWTQLPEDVGYIKVRSFQKTTVNEVKEAVRELESQGMSALVLDLRNNPGGLLDQAISVSELFLEDGKLIVYTKGRLTNQDMKGFSKGGNIWSSQPLAILINGGSASASEIVAGALKDWDRATLIGTQSFGKGSVQTIIPLSDGSGLRLTTAKYYTPNNAEIHGEGITPDIVVELEPVTPSDDPEEELRSRRRMELPGEDMTGDAQLQKAFDFLTSDAAAKKKAAQAGAEE
ncbi:MAG: S41 family peptidase [Candidatus Tectomicrobia bacterium]|nr:S41 family peptidase [Candidatus Tectomicrobia bacterium]